MGRISTLSLLSFKVSFTSTSRQNSVYIYIYMYTHYTTTVIICIIIIIISSSSSSIIINIINITIIVFVSSPVFHSDVCFNAETKSRNRLCRLPCRSQCLLLQRRNKTQVHYHRCGLSFGCLLVRFLFIMVNTMNHISVINIVKLSLLSVVVEVVGLSCLSFVDASSQKLIPTPQFLPPGYSLFSYVFLCFLPRTEILKSGVGITCWAPKMAGPPFFSRPQIVRRPVPCRCESIGCGNV